jgi:hypothetical protein
MRHQKSQGQDSEFLLSLGLMDYSLLVVREEVATDRDRLTRNIGGSANMTCHFGIIDYL